MKILRGGIMSNDKERGPYCINCTRSLRGGEYTDAWEDGNNEYAYVICPHCRCKNEIYED